mmetsp:Transcript_11472/g.29059  ORF Transcript_11472/g.29059 Transcript_11472/m.29059 type:complete len:348 (+) Transcript_11472:105-1148(+)
MRTEPQIPQACPHFGAGIPFPRGSAPRPPPAYVRSLSEAQAYRGNPLVALLLARAHEVEAPIGHLYRKGAAITTSHERVVRRPYGGAQAQLDRFGWRGIRALLPVGEQLSVCEHEPAQSELLEARALLINGALVHNQLGHAWLRHGGGGIGGCGGARGGVIRQRPREAKALTVGCPQHALAPVVRHAQRDHRAAVRSARWQPGVEQLHQRAARASACVSVVVGGAGVRADGSRQTGGSLERPPANRAVRMACHDFWPPGQRRAEPLRPADEGGGGECLALGQRAGRARAQHPVDRPECQPRAARHKQLGRVCIDCKCHRRVDCGRLPPARRAQLVRVQQLPTRQVPS